MTASAVLLSSTKSLRHRGVRRWALFTAMLLSGGMLLFPRVPLLLLLVVLCFWASGFRAPSIRRSWPVWMLLATVLAAAVLRPGPFDWYSLVIRYANFIAALLLLGMYARAGKSAVLDDLNAILPWMAVQALLTFFLANSVPFLFMPVASGDFSFNTILLVFNYHELVEDYSGLKRPNGFFFEPGVFQMYLNVFLYLSLFVFKSRKNVLLATAAVFCTLSTTGLGIALMLLGAALFQRTVLGGKLREKLGAFLIIVIVMPILGLVAYNNFMEKFSGDMQGSAMAREYDLYTGLNLIGNYPMLGIGFDHGRYLELAPFSAFADTLLSQESTEDRATSNGVIYLFYTIGIPLGLVFLFGIFSQRIFPLRLVFGVLIFVSLLSEAIIYTPFILMIIFSAFFREAAPRKSLKMSEASA